ncbi:MAG: hypothetical protein WEE89_16680 [Gemmatimonadota bacterium]
MRGFGWSLLLMACLPVTAVAHETGVIRLGAKTASAGGQLEIRGSKLTKGTEFRLELRGVMKTFTLLNVRTDTTGQFVVHLSLPADAAPGNYTVVAVAPDKDVVARADLAMTAAVPQPTSPMPVGHEGMAPSASGTPHATDAMMDLPVSTGSVEWAAITAMTALSLFGGLWLLLRRAQPA